MISQMYSNLETSDYRIAAHLTYATLVLWPVALILALGLGTLLARILGFRGKSTTMFWMTTVTILYLSFESQTSAVLQYLPVRGSNLDCMTMTLEDLEKHWISAGSPSSELRCVPPSRPWRPAGREAAGPCCASPLFAVCFLLGWLVASRSAGVPGGAAATGSPPC